jgi:hypothetical protein
MSIDQILTLIGVGVQVITMVLGGLYALSKIDGRLSMLVKETEIRHITNTEKFTVIDKKLNELVVSTMELVKQEMRMNHLDERLQELSARIQNLYNNGNGNSKPPKTGVRGRRD